MPNSVFTNASLTIVDYYSNYNNTGLQLSAYHNLTQALPQRRNRTAYHPHDSGRP